MPPVLDDLHAGIVPDDLVAILKLADTTDVQTHGGVELQGVTTRSRFGGAVGIPTDLLSELVDEDTGGIGLADSPRDLTQGLRHEAGLQTYLRLTHIALDLLLRHQGCDGVDDDQVDGTRADDLLGDMSACSPLSG